jgi:hypothetical protein
MSSKKKRRVMSPLQQSACAESTNMSSAPGKPPGKPTSDKQPASKTKGKTSATKSKSKPSATGKEAKSAQPSPSSLPELSSLSQALQQRLFTGLDVRSHRRLGRCSKTLQVMLDRSLEGPCTELLTPPVVL